MHEFSIAESVLNVAEQHVPPGCVLRRVTLRVGPMRGIEREAMEWAWQAITQNRVLLDLELSRWRLRCRACGREFIADDSAISCTCGSADVMPHESDHLQLIEIDIEERNPSHACESRRKCAQTQ